MYHCAQCHSEYVLPKYIVFPTGQRLSAVVNGFGTKWNLPQCTEAIDGCHIPIRAPALNHTDYFNCKGWYSIIIEAVVDSAYLFCDIYAGWPGSVHDTHVFANSSLYKKAKPKDVPTVLVGDYGYPLHHG